jgi:adenylate kinase family enzyme
MNVAQHLVGIDSHVVKMKNLLNLETRVVRTVGIYGMGGIGKTTVAKAVYNKICVVFEGSSFLSNLKESSKNPNDLVRLQKQLLNDILKMNLKIDSVDEGIIQIKKRLRDKRVLVILDDVDHNTQLQALVGNFEWLGSGSKIIVTTRDEHILTQLRVNKKYKVEELNNWESLQLFSYHAFEMASPTDDYKELLISVVEYARGLP